MSKPTLTEVYNALGVLERAGMLEKMQMKQTRGSSTDRLTATETSKILDRPTKNKRHRMSKEQIDRAVVMYNDEKATITEIARELGFSAPSIRYNLGL